MIYKSPLCYGVFSAENAPCVSNVNGLIDGDKVRFRFRKDYFSCVFVKRGSSITKRFLEKTATGYALGEVVAENR